MSEGPELRTRRPNLRGLLVMAAPPALFLPNPIAGVYMLSF